MFASGAGWLLQPFLLLLLQVEGNDFSSTSPFGAKNRKSVFYRLAFLLTYSRKCSLNFHSIIPGHVVFFSPRPFQKE